MLTFEPAGRSTGYVPLASHATATTSPGTAMLLDRVRDRQAQAAQDAAAEPLGLTTAGALIMVVSVTGILTLVISCYTMVLRSTRRDDD